MRQLVFVSTALLMAASPGCALASSSPARCFSSAAEAARQSDSTAETPPDEKGQTGFRVAASRFDAMLGRMWFVVASCDHPEWPLVTVEGHKPVLPTDTAAALLKAAHTASGSLAAALSPGRSASVNAPFPVLSKPLAVLNTPLSVKAGSMVRLLRVEDQMRMELSAVAEASGRVGDRVRVRLVRFQTEVQMPEQYLTGIVRGPDFLEMEP